MMLKQKQHLITFLFIITQLIIRVASLYVLITF